MKAVHHRGIFFGLLSAFLSLAFGCGDPEDAAVSPSYKGPTNACVKDRDCPSGTGCDPGLSKCIRAEDISLRRIFVKLVSPERPPQVFQLTFTRESTATVSYQEPLTVPILARAATPEGAKIGLNARVYLMDNATIPGQSPWVYTLENAEGDEIRYLKLLPGEGRYTVQVMPKDATESVPPPSYFDNVSVVRDEEAAAEHAGKLEGEGIVALTAASDAENSGSINALVLDPIDSGHSLRGEIVRAGQPQAGVRVEAVDLENGRIISTPAVTGCSDRVCGDFEIHFYGPDGEDSANPVYGLRIRRPDNPSYPEAMVRSDHGVSIGGGRRVFDLGPLGNPVLFDARVEGVVLLDDGFQLHDGLESCLVVFLRSQESMASVVRNEVFGLTIHNGKIRTRADGSSIYLFPGAYQVHILPPAAPFRGTLRYGALVADRVIDPAVDAVRDQVFTLPTRQRIAVTVALGGERIPGARLFAEPLDPASRYASAPVPAEEVDGRHILWLDEGAYRLTAEVPIGTGLAMGIARLAVSAKAPSLGGGPETIVLPDVTPPVPVVARLQIEAAEALPAGLLVEWYEVLDGEGLLIARSRVGRSGRSIGLLPPGDSVE